MVYYLSLFLILWAMIFSIGRFFRYYRIVKEYTGHTEAKVIRVQMPLPLQAAAQRSGNGTRNRRGSSTGKAGKAAQVLLEYCIEGTTGHAEIAVPPEEAGRFSVGTEVAICYKVSGNGAVHIASDTGANKALLRAHALAIAVELAAFVLIWRSML